MVVLRGIFQWLETIFEGGVKWKRSGTKKERPLRTLFAKKLRLF